MSKILTEIYNSNKDVCIDDLPDGWKDSFNNFLFGQTIYKNKEGKFCAYSHDYAVWYRQNKISIERETKIDEIC